MDSEVRGGIIASLLCQSGPALESRAGAEHCHNFPPRHSFPPAITTTVLIGCLCCGGTGGCDQGTGDVIVVATQYYQDETSQYYSVSLQNASPPDQECYWSPTI